MRRFLNPNVLFVDLCHAASRQVFSLFQRQRPSRQRRRKGRGRAARRLSLRIEQCERRLALDATAGDGGFLDVVPGWGSDSTGVVVETVDGGSFSILSPPASGAISVSLFIESGTLLYWVSDSSTLSANYSTSPAEASLAEAAWWNKVPRLEVATVGSGAVGIEAANQALENSVSISLANSLQRTITDSGRGLFDYTIESAPVVANVQVAGTSVAVIGGDAGGDRNLTLSGTLQTVDSDLPGSAFRAGDCSTQGGVVFDTPDIVSTQGDPEDFVSTSFFYEKRVFSAGGDAEATKRDYFAVKSKIKNKPSDERSPFPSLMNFSPGSLDGLALQTSEPRIAVLEAGDFVIVVASASPTTVDGNQGGLLDLNAVVAQTQQAETARFVAVAFHGSSDSQSFPHWHQPSIQQPSPEVARASVFEVAAVSERTGVVSPKPETDAQQASPGTDQLSEIETSLRSMLPPEAWHHDQISHAMEAALTAVFAAGVFWADEALRPQALSTHNQRVQLASQKRQPW